MVISNKWAFSLLREVDINRVVRFDHKAFSDYERFAKTLVNVMYHLKEQFSGIYCYSRNSRQIIDSIDTSDFDYSLMEKVLCPAVYLVDKDSFLIIEQADRIYFTEEHLLVGAERQSEIELQWCEISEKTYRSMMKLKCQ